jgi:hypothetical protein
MGTHVGLCVGVGVGVGVILVRVKVRVWVRMRWVLVTSCMALRSVNTGIKKTKLTDMAPSDLLTAKCRSHAHGAWHRHVLHDRRSPHSSARVTGRRFMGRHAIDAGGLTLPRVNAIHLLIDDIHTRRQEGTERSPHTCCLCQLPKLKWAVDNRQGNMRREEHFDAI